MGPAAPAEEEKGYRVPELAHSPGPAVQPRRNARVLRRRWQEPGLSGKRQGASGALGQDSGAAGCSTMLLFHRLPLPSGVPASLCHEPSLLGRHCPAHSLLPALFVFCLTLLNAS